MDKDLLAKFIDLMNSENDSDAIMGLRGVQNLFKDIGGSFKNTLMQASDNIIAIEVNKKQSSFINSASLNNSDIAENKIESVNESGVPELRVLSEGSIELVLSGNSSGKIYKLPEESAIDIIDIAENMKDSMVAAIISKCKFKLKLFDIKDDGGNIIETELRAEYEREDVIPVKIWSNNSRGETGLLASVLRKLVSTNISNLYG